MNDSLTYYDSLSDEDKLSLLTQLYVQAGLSWSRVAAKVNSYANKVRRDAVRLGLPSRDKSEAQSAALKSGRHSHPTKNKVRPDSVKNKISDGVAKKWDEIDDATLAERKRSAKERWDQKTPQEVMDFREAAGNGVRKAAKEGSALEKFLLYELIRAGYKVDFHKEHWVIREQLQIDLFVPELNVAIEVDGPSHFKDIWGQENLSKNQQRDAEKTGMLLERGLCIIRVRQLKSLSLKYKRTIKEKLLQILSGIKDKFPDRGDRHIILGELQNG